MAREAVSLNGCNKRGRDLTQRQISSFFCRPAAVAVSRFEVCKTSKVPGRERPKAALPPGKPRSGEKKSRSDKKCCGSNMTPPQGGKVFLPYFLYFTKSRKKKSPQGGGEAAERQKMLRQQQKKPPRAAKGFNWVCAKPPLRRAESRFAEPRNSLRGRTDCHFLRRAKSNQKARGTPSCDLDSKLYRKKF